MTIATTLPRPLLCPFALLGSLLFLAACASTGPGGTPSWTGVTERPATKHEPRGEPRAGEPAAQSRDDAPLPPPDATMLRARIYEAMARVSYARAGGDLEAVEAALDEAMEGIRQLAATPGTLDDPEMRELYRSVVTAYEQYYGVPDTLQTEYGEIFAFRDAMFEAMNALDEPLLEDVMLPPVTPAATTIPLHRNRLVEQSIRFLLKEPDRHLHKWLSRAATYFPMIEQILREEGVPDELKYLAMIESGLNPRARSRASAVGMWQFMSATGRAYGLQVTHWVDERRDPEKSTRAAARHLRDLYETFGNWHYVLAAYNSGAGRVRQAMRRAGVTSARETPVWEIYPYLPRETRNYIPMFMATVMVASNPGAFGVQPVAPGPRYAYDVAEVEGMLDLGLVAEMAGTDVETIRALNPELRQWATPPSSTPYRLRLPAGTRDRFTAAYAALPEERRQSVAIHTVRRGDTLGKIARRYDTTVAAIQEVNGLRGTTIQVGQTLHVPVRYEAYAGVTASTGGHVQYGSRPPGEDATPVVTASLTAGDRAAGPAPGEAASEHRTRVRYHVRRGDNLTEIARRYGVTVDDLQRWNDLTGSRIYPGQTLTVYPGEAGTAASTGRKVTYQVRPGDNLTRIAARYGVTVDDLRRWNDLRSDHIRAGQRLTIYAGEHTGTGGRWISYTVRRGDTLTEIGRRYGATPAELRKWNALRTDRLLVGQRLAIFVR
ncbi:LysM peptidoglycan-binding domain-containing protein [Rhodocaloribacter litoris]|uniref:lytic transglycosylase n=1 Tax=Rhodocaloribacter litoris TaxID=2558931 RepID=UPI00141DEFF4|nr:LysM peptidoglycan-binding domain-containing protein [Rhodocaloribacter litoris]QXD14057.1 LysM peptidoglycan-binding domain-containing protein [Rhodocaloribacter litoris]